MRKFQSTARRRKRAGKTASTGKPTPLHERKVIESMMNEGGFYQGMPGVSIDKKGNRRIMNFVITPEGNENAFIFAHPRIVKTAIENAMKHREIGAIVMSAAIDKTFKNKFNPIYFLIRTAFKFKRWSNNYKLKRKHKREQENA